MTPVKLQAALETVKALRKLAESDNADTVKTASLSLAAECDSIFEALAAAACPENAKIAGTWHTTHPTFRNACRMLPGERVARRQDDVCKLAAACELDNVFSQQMREAPETKHAELRALKSLGREYAVSVLERLLA